VYIYYIIIYVGMSLVKVKVGEKKKLTLPILAFECLSYVWSHDFSSDLNTFAHYTVEII